MAHLYPQSVGVEPIKRFTSTLANAAEQVPFDTPVPTCGDWTMADLVWHLTEVQDFWGHIIAARPHGSPKFYERPERPADSRLVSNLRNANAGLCTGLKSAAPTDAAWSWSKDQTVGFSLRRQTHEALTHCIDALLVTGEPMPEISAELAADGIDEIMHVMLDPRPETETGTVTLHAVDTDDQWAVRCGQGDATVSGTALDLNMWLWGRGKTWPLSVAGDVDQAAVLRAAVAGRM